MISSHSQIAFPRSMISGSDVIGLLEAASASFDRA